jgi:adenylate cyclase
MQAPIEYNIKNLHWIVAHWVLIGFLAFAFETLLLYQEKSYSSHFFTFLWYLIPPVLFGWPFLVFENRVLRRWIKQIDFRLSLLLRVTFYLGGMIGVYYLIQQTAFMVYGIDHPFATHSLWKFLFVWVPGSVFALLFHSLTARLDPATFVSWIKGEYHKPMDEVRVFLFADINESTAIAESLGSRKYFEFLDLFFSLTTPVIQKYKGEIYQYVGDEIVISWPLEKALNSANAIHLFFRLSQILEQNQQHFMEAFGYRPVIKGSLHFGKVTKGELGRVKKELIFTGDVLNTAARMHNICKKIEAPLVVSRRLLKQFSDLTPFQVMNEGYFNLPGKTEQIFIYSLKEVQEDQHHSKGIDRKLTFS